MKIFEVAGEGKETPEKEIERLKLRQNAEHGGASLQRQAATQARIRELEKQIKDKKQDVAEGDISGIMHAAKNYNKSFLITAELAEGGKKTFRVRAQSERVAREKFAQHYNQATIVSVKEEGLKEFAPAGSGDGREPNEEEILRQLASQWWLGTEQQMAKAQRTLEIMGWEIGQDESGDDDAGVFLIRAGDEHGDSYIAFNHSDLELHEGQVNEMASKLLSAEDRNGVITVIVQAPDGTKRSLANENPRYINQWLDAKYGLTLPRSIMAKFVESDLNESFKSKEDAVKYAKERVKTFRDKEDGIEVWAMPDGSFDVNHTMNSNGRNHIIDAGGKKLGVITP